MKKTRISKLSELTRSGRELFVEIKRSGGILEIPVRWCNALEKERLDALVPDAQAPSKVGGDGKPYLDFADPEYRKAQFEVLLKRRDNFVAWLLGPGILGDGTLAEQVQAMKEALSENEIAAIAIQGASPHEVTDAAVTAKVEQAAPFAETPPAT